LLITDIAPPAALIQRLGRLNRDDDEPSQTKRAMIFDRPDATPYTEQGGKNPSAEFALAYKWLERLEPGARVAFSTTTCLSAKESFDQQQS
jgi:CRISPR/Cas system-associated endonuclease/helicase Cas3